MPGQATPSPGWKAIAAHAFKEFNDDHITMIAAGITFYIVLALFPAMAAFASLYGLVADVGQVARQVQRLSHILPGGAVSIIGDQLRQLASTRSGGLSLAFAVGVLTALWSANGAVGAIITGLNIAYGKQERRGLIRRTLISLAFTVGLILFAALAMGLLVASSSAARALGPAAGILANVISWPAIVVVTAMGVALLYRYGPCREPVAIRWITWGAAAAVIAWAAMSALFSLYVANFGHYNKTYGSLGAAVGFMTWLYLSSLVLLAGAELNAEVENRATQKA